MTFRFKRFSVSQDHSAMKVGTDGVLLGAWANGGKRILDIGAGTGLISLMMSQRFPDADVVGIEIDHGAAEDAKKNVAASPFAPKIEIREMALQDYRPEGKFDSIVSNPPFFTNGFITPDEARRRARQTDSLTFDDVVTFSKSWLTDDGEMSVVLPASEQERFSESAFFQGFFLSRRYLLCTVPRKKPKRCLLAFSLMRPRNFDSAECCLMDAGGKKTEWYRNLTQEFYLDRL